MSTSIFGPTIKRRHHRSTTRRSPPAWRKVAFLRQATLGQGVPSDEPSPVPFVSNTPNDVATPFSFRDSGLPVPGAADIFYSMGRWDLRDDEALVMTGTLPAGRSPT